jgi:hypothetical protein
MLRPSISVAVSEDSAASECRLLPSTAHEYGRTIVNAEGRVENLPSLLGADKIEYLFTPYGVSIEAEIKKAMPQFLLVWWIERVCTTPP